MRTILLIFAGIASLALVSGCMEKASQKAEGSVKPVQQPSVQPAERQHVPLLQTKALAPVAIRPLKIKDEKFVDADGNAVNFWGVNLCSFFPDRDLADKTAANLASLGVNMVRPHHTMRPSKDWNSQGPIALAKYNGNSRDMDLDAWDRFDYLNAKLREKGIYLSLAVWWSRNYEPADVSIKKVSDADDKAWSDAVKEMNSWHWQKAFDPRKLMAMFDERSFLLNAEFAKFMLTRVNKYSGISYGKDPQVMSLEFLNECDPEYILVCKNVFPEYFKKELVAKLDAFVQGKDAKTFDFYNMVNNEQKQLFSEFCGFLIQDFSRRMTQAVREYGYDGPVIFSNLWESETNLNARSTTDSYIEDHCYGNPFPVEKKDDLFFSKTKGILKGKPFIVGEMNMSEDQKVIKEKAPVRSMLPLAISAYGSLQDWAGVTWFAWNHGARDVGADGWAKNKSRAPSIGTLCGDGVFLDHFRTTGIIFRNGYVKGSSVAITLTVDAPYFPAGYQEMIRGKYNIKPGWQNIHKVRKSYGPMPSGQKTAEWMTAEPAGEILKSDTGEIIKDISRKQLTVSAPKAEGFSGYLDDKAPEGLKVINIRKVNGFATVVLVPLDDKPITQSSHLLISRTYTVADGSESDDLSIVLKGLPANSKWSFSPTRSRGAATDPDVPSVTAGAESALVVPSGNWTECELELK
ncbi:MAG TPA: hypothetical protein DET40_06380 [Lentisphaeria bacterium]|nr:MAG: hypothetical protein A2X45_17750 [Lentisphaerae bacterium GWF2_50_93]HCE43154.1 hypothetical protein [Lentisphaeria bacterium]